MAEVARRCQPAGEVFRLGPSWLGSPRGARAATSSGMARPRYWASRFCSRRCSVFDRKGRWSIGLLCAVTSFGPCSSKFVVHRRVLKAALHRRVMRLNDEPAMNQTAIRTPWNRILRRLGWAPSGFAWRDARAVVLPRRRPEQMEPSAPLDLHDDLAACRP